MIVYLSIKNIIDEIQIKVKTAVCPCGTAGEIHWNNSCSLSTGMGVRSQTVIMQICVRHKLLKSALICRTTEICIARFSWQTGPMNGNSSLSIKDLKKVKYFLQSCPLGVIVLRLTVYSWVLKETVHQFLFLLTFSWYYVRMDFETFNWICLYFSLHASNFFYNTYYEEVFFSVPARIKKIVCLNSENTIYIKASWLMSMCFDKSAIHDILICSIYANYFIENRKAFLARGRSKIKSIQTCLLVSWSNTVT